MYEVLGNQKNKTKKKPKMAISTLGEKLKLKK